MVVLFEDLRKKAAFKICLLSFPIVFFISEQYRTLLPFYYSSKNGDLLLSFKEDNGTNFLAKTSRNEDGNVYTSAQKCRIELEKYLNPIIDEMLEMGDEMPPLIDWVWDMGNHFKVSLMYHPIVSWNAWAFMGATWTWQDQFGQNFSGIVENRGTKATKFVRLELPKPSNETTVARTRSTPVFLWASNHQLPANKTVANWVYDLRPFLKCDRIDIEDERPAPGTKIGMCVRFRGGHEQVAPHVAYHQTLGVQHTWFYHNEEFNIEDLPLSDSITYVPYNFVWKDHVNHSRTGDKNLPWRIWGGTFWQVTAMHQCLFRAKRYGLDWIMMPDIDEYLWLDDAEENVTMQVSAPSVSHRNGTTANTTILQNFLKEYEGIANLGALQIDGWAFGTNQTGQEGAECKEFEVDYVHRGAIPCGGRRKLIYRVANSESLSVHNLRKGGSKPKVPITRARWNHYRSPCKGIFYLDRKHNHVVSDPSLPNKYRDLMVEWIKEHKPGQDGKY